MDPNEKVGPSEKSELSESVRPSKIAQTSLAPLPRLFGWSHFQNFILLVSVGRTNLGTLGSPGVRLGSPNGGRGGTQGEDEVNNLSNLTAQRSEENKCVI